MNIFKVLKRKIENFKTKPDKEFEFENDYFGNTDTIKGFKFIYCNNYTDKLYSFNKDVLSFISCEIILPKTNKIYDNILEFISCIYMENDNNIFSNFKYKNYYLQLKPNEIHIYLRGDLLFYKKLCNNIRNNIITKYIHNNIFPNDIPINTPNEYLDNIYNSITNPYKEIDILFIEDKISCSSFIPVIGLSISDFENIDFKNKCNNFICLNDRCIIYIEIDKLSNDELQNIINNKYRGYEKLLDILHNNITIDGNNIDVDEIIEE